MSNKFKLAFILIFLISQSIDLSFSAVISPTISALKPKILQGEDFQENVSDNEKFMLLDSTSSLVFKQTANPEATSGHFTLIPPAGHGLIAVVQSLNLRIDTNGCSSGLAEEKDTYVCAKCMDYIKFSTADKNSSETCGFLTYKKAWSSFSQTSYLHVGNVMYRGSISFVSGIDQELVINIVQHDPDGILESYSVDSSEFPILEVVVSVYSNNCTDDDKLNTKCSSPDGRKGNTYCISKELICDDMANCPAYDTNNPGGYPSSSALDGLGDDEKGCKSEVVATEDPIDGYGITILSMDKLFNNENFERGIPSNENTNKMVTISETKSSVNEMDQAKPLAKEDIYDDEGYNKVTFAHVTFTAMEVLLIIVSGFIVGIYLTRYCLRLQPFQAMTRFTIPYSNPIYHKLEVPIEQKSKNPFIGIMESGKKQTIIGLKESLITGIHKPLIKK